MCGKSPLLFWMMAICCFDVLFRHGPHCQPISPMGDDQRIHVARAEAQAGTAVEHVGRNGRPIVTADLHAVDRTIGDIAVARSGEIDRRGVAAVGPEVPTKVGIEVGGIFGALHVHFFCLGGIDSRSSEPRKGIVGRQFKADRAGVVNGFDHRKVVTGVGILRSGIIGRP